ncbi:hypothetical protein ACH4SK_43940 [Streptomyces inhibens]|uniref:hypothetical protein n=1 Tax=Streptomyces inhibens TaxID=2293571 RepID=UPI003792039E
MIGVVKDASVGIVTSDLPIEWHPPLDTGRRSDHQPLERINREIKRRTVPSRSSPTRPPSSG